MTISKNKLLIAYDYDAWYGYSRKDPVIVDVSKKNNAHTLICGMSGSGKSYLLMQYLVRLKLCGDDEIFYFSDYKREDAFKILRQCTHYYAYNGTIDALDEVYSVMQKRQKGDDPSRKTINLIWDEYVNNMLAISSNKKKMGEVTNKISEILMMGRSLGIRLIIVCQRPDVEGGFPRGSRLNFGIIIILGAVFESVYSMVMPKELMARVGERSFYIGEGVMLWQGTDLYFIKVPIIRDEEKMKAICIEALN